MGENLPYWDKQNIEGEGGPLLIEGERPHSKVDRSPPSLVEPDFSSKNGNNGNA
jgi:hypothetical protein